MRSGNEILEAANRLETYMVNESFGGYDPYDALSSPLFDTGPLSSRTMRMGGQQLFRRSPINLRNVLKIPRGYNPVTLALSLQAFVYAQTVACEKKDQYQTRIEFLRKELDKLQSPGYEDSCWGYDFAWEGRYSSFPRFLPTLVATGDVTNALYEDFRSSGNQRSLDLCRSSISFIERYLNRLKVGEMVCYSYSPLDRQWVFNATMKAARLLSQMYSTTNDATLKDEARGTVLFVLAHQREDGSWPYSFGDGRTWVDNFHTGYVLDCLDEYVQLTGDPDPKVKLGAGVDFYVRHFFTSDGLPKYYRNRTYPIDSTAAAQSILTLTRFGYIELATKVASWMIEHMQDPSGYFYYQKTKVYTNKISYMRWSNAWMLLALFYLLKARNGVV